MRSQQPSHGEVGLVTNEQLEYQFCFNKLNIYFDISINPRIGNSIQLNSIKGKRAISEAYK